LAEFDSPTVEPRRVVRAALVNQLLWTAGFALTSGGYLSYFGRELGARGVQIAILLAVPETVGILGLFTRRLVLHARNRKHVWLVCSLLARLASLGIPLMAFPNLRPPSLDPLWILIGALATASAFGSLAYVAFLSWMADLVPGHRWGRFFALRNIADVVTLMLVPVLAGYLLDAWKQRVDTETALLGYVFAFVLGTLLQLGSMLPINRLPDVPLRVVSEQDTGHRTALQGGHLSFWRHEIPRLWGNRSLRLLCLHNWHLAVAQGMTQAAFFLWQKDVLKISLGTYLVLQQVMRLAMVPASLLAGKWSDRGWDLAALTGGLLFVSLAMPFWLATSPERWWLTFGAYLCWGGFAVVNITGRNLVLKVSPTHDNMTQLSLYLQPAGLLAGISGILGGLWLDQLIEHRFEMTWGNWIVGPFQLVFLISWGGRLTAPLWLYGVWRQSRKRK